MFVRLRWFIYGFVSSIGVIAYLTVQVKRARERLSAAALVRSGGQTVASLLDRTADRVAPAPADEGATGTTGPTPPH